MSYYRRAYTKGGTFFFTVNVADRSYPLLTENIDRLREAFRYAQHKLPYDMAAVCVLPDHLHAIWTLPDSDTDYSTRWSLIKSYFSRGLTTQPLRSASKTAKREKGVWQRRFWEHQIRDESDLQRHVDYIHFNPVKHGLVNEVRQWPYSSFHRYVKAGLLPIHWALAPDAQARDSAYGE